MIARFTSALPKGGTLSDAEWRSRHRLLTWVFVGHMVVLGVLGVVVGEAPFHLLLELVPLLGVLALASRSASRRSVRSVVLALGLLACSALLIHLVDGTTEAHFHFFVVLPLITLYQRWSPLLAPLGFVVVHHLLMASIAPDLLFDTRIATENPFWFVIIHAVFVLLAVAVLVAFWKLAEHAVLAAEDANRNRAAHAEQELARRSGVQLRTGERVDALGNATDRADALVLEVAAAVARLADVAGKVAGDAAASAQVAEASTELSDRGVETADRLHASSPNCAPSWPDIADRQRSIDGAVAEQPTTWRRSPASWVRTAWIPSGSSPSSESIVDRPPSSALGRTGPSARVGWGAHH